MISVYNKKDNCCGCTACKHVCPTKAISMINDSEGFLYPLINQDLCIDCGRCKSVCAFQNGYNTIDNLETPIVYAAKNKDNPTRLSSTSGGAFSALSDFILKNNGFVFGALFDDNMEVIHNCATTKQGRDKFKGSKYVQSNLGDVYKEIEKLLLSNELVMFSGTPCQAAGLKSYLAGVDNSRLYICDIVCHGTPSPLMWREHIKHLERKYNSKVVNYQFRSKIKGWHGHNELAVFENGKTDYTSLASQKHKVLFYSHSILRPACHNCKYTNFKRPSDITIADFWGIDKVMPSFDDNVGVSLILINNEKGEKWFENSSNPLEVMKSNVLDCQQPQLQYPSMPSKQRNQFWDDYHKKGYDYIIKKYGDYNIKTYIKIKLRSLLRLFGVLKHIQKVRNAIILKNKAKV